jgi:putative alpha-1,2-mannosidase
MWQLGKRLTMGHLALLLAVYQITIIRVRYALECQKDLIHNRARAVAELGYQRHFRSEDTSPVMKNGLASSESCMTDS